MTEAVNMSLEPGSTSEVVERARAWIGTPYVHQASCCGGGTDCLGLLRGLWREIFGDEPEAIPPYSANWTEPNKGEDLLLAASRHLIPVAVSKMRPGDVLIIRMKNDAPAKHVAILASMMLGEGTIVHAYSGHGVVESPLTPAWFDGIAGVYRFPFNRRL